MGTAVFSKLVRAWGHKGFSNRTLEAEFLTAFRSHGVRFLFASSMVAATCFLAFFLFNVLSGRHHLSQPNQLTRLSLAIVLLGFALAARRCKAFFTRHYAVACVSAVCVTMLANGQIALEANRLPGQQLDLYWTLTTSTVLATMMIYGFARLRPGTTVLLGLFMALTAMGFASMASSIDTYGFHRMVTHIAAANILGYSMYRFAMGRERKLYLQSRRKNHVAELRRTKEKAEAANRAKTAFLANMSHEIRTPMNGVIGALSMLNEASLPERDRLFVKSARDSARNLLRLLDEVLDFAKLDAQKVKLSPAAFDPRDTVVAACEAFGATALQKGIGLRGDTHGIPAGVKSMVADEGKLRQVLLNLVSNAVKFTQHGEVAVTASVRDLAAGQATLVIAVSDTGMGIPPSAMEHLYQPFFQVESGNSRSHGGTGLGLAICKQITEEMGGHIQARSQQGRGTTFELTFTLPFSHEAPVPHAHDLRDPGFQDTTPPPEQDLRLQGHVLLVEDNEVNAFIATMTLESLGLQSSHARHGAQAVQMVRDARYDAILMDCEMPVMDGYEAVRLIRAHEAAHPSQGHTPIVALTAHALSGDREVCLQGGMDDYLTKPFDRAMLAGMLAQWLPRQQATA
ncbi:ATP-binding protein, partial [Aquabacterium sp.]|uniref:ATP-binding protein n=1 Tax=Aquabacterium sp. TaxID=1872578 RepID=UPI0025C2B894